MNPLICPQWDGCHIWLQWDDAQAPYEVEVRYSDGTAGWGEWEPLAGGIERSWAVLPTWKEFSLVQARIRDASGQCETAKLVDFQRARCRFEFLADHEITLPAGAHFHTFVDNAPCSYELPAELHLEAGIPRLASMQSLQDTGYAQLDYEGHFLLQEAGIQIRNTEPSRDDVQILSEGELPIISRRAPAIFTMVCRPPAGKPAAA